jgi:hypothetical protein
MKIIISESQYRLILENEDKTEISPGKLKIYKKTIKRKGLIKASKLLNKEIYELIEMGVVESYDGDLDLEETQIETLSGLTSVGGDLMLYNTSIKSLGNLKSVGGGLYLKNTLIKSLGELKSVGGSLNLEHTPIESLGDLESVGKYLYLTGTSLSKTMTKEEIADKLGMDKKDIYL